MKKTNKKGFTIVELVIVIAVIAILSAVLIPTFTNVIDKANKSAAEQAATSAVTGYLADDVANVTNKKVLIVDTGDYLVTVNTNNSKTVAKDTANNKITAIAENAAVAVGDYKLVDGKYVKVTEAIAAGTEQASNGVTADTYFTVSEIANYTFYGVFEGCAVYVAA